MPKRSKDEMFLVVLTDAVAAAYEVPGLKADKVVSLVALRKLLDRAGLLRDAAGKAYANRASTAGVDPWAVSGGI